MKYFLTGSRIYGEATENSDIDIVMIFEDSINFKKVLNEKNIEIFKSKAQKKCQKD